MAVVWALFLVLGGNAPAHAGIVDPMTMVYNQVVNGDFIMVGNGVLAGVNTIDGDNGVTKMAQSDVDSNPATFNSSRATVAIPSGAKVVKAQLFWGGSTGYYQNSTTAPYGWSSGCQGPDYGRGAANTKPTGSPSTTNPIITVGSGTATTVPVSHYITETPAQVAYENPQYYTADNDVTSLLAGASGSVTVTVGNVWAPAGYNCVGGWSLAVVYDFGSYQAGVPASQARNVILFDGHVRVDNTSAPVATSYTGFTAAGTGSRVGITAYEGDGTITGDQAGYTLGTYSSSATPTYMGNAYNGATNNFFISGAYGASGAPASSTVTNGASLNGNIDVTTNNVNVPAGTTQFNLVVSTSGDSYMVQNAIISVPVGRVTLDKSYDGTVDTQTVNQGVAPSFTIKVTNTGSVPLSNVTVSDPLAPNCAKTFASLAAGAVQTYTCTGPPAGATSYTNTATVSSTDPNNGSVTGGDSTSVVVNAPSIDVAKSAQSVTGPDTNGVYTATYAVTVKNSGNGYGFFGPLTDTPAFATNYPIQSLTWSGASSGSQSGGSPVTLAPANTQVNAGQTLTYTVAATFKITDGTVSSACTGAVGAGLYNAVSGGTVTNGDTNATNNAACAAPPAFVNLSKTAGPVTGPDANGNYTAVYTLTVKNTGGAAASYGPLTDTPAFDPAFAVTGATWSGQGSGSATGAGPYTVAPTGTSIAAGATHTYQVVVTFHFVGTPSATCASGKGLYNAAALGSGQEQGATTDNAGCDTVPAPPAPALTVSKGANPTSVSSVGQVVTYTFTVTNTGNVTLSSVGVADTQSAPAGPLTLGPTCQASTLAPHTSTTCTATYTVTQADLDNGTVKDSATASGTPPYSTTPVTSAPSAATVATVTTPSISLTKTASRQTVTTAGTSIAYSFLVTNTGTGTVTGLSLSDVWTQGGSAPLGTISCPVTTLAPNASTTCTATYTASQTDINGGALANTATATATASNGSQVTATSSASVTATQSPAMTMTKSANVTSVNAVGQVITYSFLITNTGNVTITNIYNYDTYTTGGVGIPGGTFTGFNCPTRTLDPGQQVTCTHTYTVQQGDIGAGVIANTGRTTSRTAAGANLQATSTATVAVVQSSSLTVAKSATPTTVSKAGDQVAYSFVVTNTGNTTLTGVTVADSLTAPAAPAPNVSCPSSTLTPGQAQTCTATYTTTQADVDHGRIDNSATASGLPPGSTTPVTSAPSTASVTIPAASSIALVKSASTTTYSSVGQQITYSFLITNTGNTTLTGIYNYDTYTTGGVGVVGGTFTGFSCPTRTLTPGQSTTCTHSYTVQQGDLDAGLIANTGRVTGNPPSGTQVQATSAASVAATLSPALTLVKTATPSSISQAGQQVTYSFKVTNSGNVTINGVSVSDTLVAPAGPEISPTCPTTTLAPGASTTCTATYTATLADVNKGVIDNTAVASGTAAGGGGPVTSPQAKAEVTIPSAPAISMAKTASPTSISAVGQQVTYTFTVTNTGNVTLSTIYNWDTYTTGGVGVPGGTFTGFTCTTRTVDPGQSAVCTHVYTVQQGDLDAGVIKNTGRVKGNAPSGAEVDAYSSATVSVAEQPALTVTKTPSVTSVNAVGQQVTYTYVVHNSGNVTLSGVGLSDAYTAGGAGTVTPPTCTPTTITPGADATCTSSYIVDQADLNQGTIANTVTASGTAPNGTVATGTATATVTAVQQPDANVVKSANPTSVSAVGQQVTYTFVVTNSGNVPLTTRSVGDAFTVGGTGTSSSIVCDVTTIQPAQSATCSLRYTVNQADLDAGVLKDTVTYVGSAPNGAQISRSGDATVSVGQNPGITVAKTANPTQVQTAGQQVTYSFKVTNSGNVTLSGVSVTDTFTEAAGTASAVTCPATTLTPGASTTCTSTYVVQQADIDAGTVSNSAVASGTPPGSASAVTSTPSTATVSAVPQASVVLTKSADPTTVTAAGQVVSYSFTVENTGNQTLTGLSIADTLTAPAAPALTVSCPTTSLGPNASTTCTARYTATQADVDHGAIDNSATATMTEPGGSTVTSLVSAAHVDIPATPAATMTKTADPTTVTTAGQTVTYTFTLVNTGNVTLTGTDMQDLFTLGGSGQTGDLMCDATSAAPGEGVTCRETYAVTQDDLNGGGLKNTATFTLVSPDGQVITPSGSATVAADVTAGMTMVKSASPTSVSTVGQQVTYTFTITNTGDVTLSHIYNYDTYTQGGVGIAGGTFTGFTCTTRTLDPGQTATCTHIYTVQQGDLDAGAIKNTGRTDGVAPDGTVLEQLSMATVTVTAAPHLTVAKTASPTTIGKAGDPVEYGFDVTNDGNVTMSGVAVDDALTPPAGPALAVSCPYTVLTPGQTMHCTAPYVSTRADIDHGGIDNTATASGTPAGSSTPVTSNPSAAHVALAATAVPSLTLTKSGTPDNVSAAGEVVSYSFLVTNTGPVTVSGISVSDKFDFPAGPAAAVTCPGAPVTLAPNESVTCTLAYTATQADVDNGLIHNIATASGQPATPGSLPVSSNSSDFYVAIDGNPQLAVIKSADPSVVAHVGDQVTYAFSVTNTGNLTLDQVGITDTFTAPAGPELSPTCLASTLTPGASTTCQATYAATQADIDAGSIHNSAVAYGTVPSDPAEGPIVSPPSDATVTAQATPGLTVVKTANPTTVSHVGDVIRYTFRVTDTGTVSMSNPTVSDTLTAPAGPEISPSCPAGTVLEPGGYVDCTATYTVTQADLDAGLVVNGAVAHATPPGSATPFDSSLSTATVSVDQQPSISVTKSADPSEISAADQTVTYTFDVRNTGTVTLTALALSDQFSHNGHGVSSAITCKATTLAPGQPTTCTMTYTTVQADVDLGGLRNSVTAAAKAPDGSTVTGTGSATVTAVDHPDLTMTKTANPTTVTTAGQQVTYSFAMTNDGNVTLTNVYNYDTYTEGGVGVPGGTYTGFTCPTRTLAPKQSTVCTHVYTVQQGDLDGGVIANTGLTTAHDLLGNPVQSTSRATVTANQAPALTLVKTPTPTTIGKAGDVVTYTFDVANSGNVSVSRIGVTDSLVAPAGPEITVSCPAGVTLVPGAHTSCTGSYTATQADVDHGSIDNTAYATGTASSGAPVTSPTTAATVGVDASPAISVVKSSTVSSVSAVGDAIPYTFHVTNTGTISLSSIAVTDTLTFPAAPAVTVTCPAGTTLAPGESVDCAGTYVVTQPDLDYGSVTNSATATGLTPQGTTPTVSQPSSFTTPAVQSPALTVVKSADIDRVDHVGQVVTYSFLVTNTGNVTMAGVAVLDTFTAPAGPPLSPTCPQRTLAPGASETCRASYAVTQADLDSTGIDNSATAQGTAPGSSVETSSPASRHHVDVTHTPSATLLKTATPTTVSLLSFVTYTFTVRNTGNVTLSSPDVVDTFTLGDASRAGPLTCDQPTVAPGGVLTCTLVYDVHQPDIDAGAIRNSAVVTLQDAFGDPTTTNTSDATVIAPQTTGMEVTKSADTTTVSAVGQVVTYSFLVRNTGNVTMTDLVLDDEMTSPASALDGPITCPITTLGPDDTTICSATYTVTQADLDAGFVVNSATAAASPPLTPRVTSDPSTVTITAADQPALAVVKKATPATVSAVGQQIDYVFTVTNTGNVALHGITVDDVLQAPSLALASGPTCPAITLEPGDSLDCHAAYLVTQADLDAGSVSDSATATGLSPRDVSATSPSAPATVSVGATPAVTVVKTASPTVVTEAGQTVTYTFVVTNSGNVTVHDPTVRDTMTAPAAGLTTGPTCPAGNVVPGHSVECTGTYVVTQADLDAGSIGNGATATALTPGGAATPVSPSSDTSVTVASAPALAVVKTADRQTVSAVGDTVGYTFDVTNTGNVTVHGVTIDDTMTAPAKGLTSGPTCPAADVAPGDTVQCTGAYVVTQADLDAGSVVNAATARAVGPGGAPVPPSLGSGTTVSSVQSPTLSVVKTADRLTVSSVGETIGYTFDVRNTGNVTVHGVTVEDTMTEPATRLTTGPTCPAGDLGPGAELVCSGTYVVTQADLDAGSVGNAATVHATGPAGALTPSSPPSDSTVAAVQTTGLTVVKSADPQTVHAVGDLVTFRFLVTNTGNLTESGISITDTISAPAGPTPQVSCPSATLPGLAAMTCTATYRITQADVDHGSVVNGATVTGTPPGSGATPVASPPSSTKVTIPAAPLLSLTKSVSSTDDVNHDGLVDAGDTVTFSFTVTNSGNVTQSHVLVDDPLLGVIGLVCAETLPAGASATCLAPNPYVVTAADVTAGAVHNTATASGTAPSGAPPTPVVTAGVDVPTTAMVTSYTVSKSVTGMTDTNHDGIVDAGDTLAYAFTVHNTGSVALTSVTVADPLLGIDHLVCAASLSAGQSVTCAAPAVHTVTIADETAGSVVNTATATARGPGGVSAPAVGATATVGVGKTPAAPTTHPTRTTAPPAATSGGLPGTGTSTAAELLWAAGLLVSGALLIVGPTRRRRRG